MMLKALIWLASLSGCSAIVASDAEQAFNSLQQWYNHSNGLWIPSTGWWNSANCLTVVADLAAMDRKIEAKAHSIFDQTYVKAQVYNMQLHKETGRGTNWLPHSYYGDHGPNFPPRVHRPPFHKTSGFLNDYYDDEGWWALAWIAVYDVTGNRQHLQAAISIFEDMAAAYGTTPCGGLWWDKPHTYINAIANELFLSVAAHLANRAGKRSSRYLDFAHREWTWFQNTGMINAQNTINDGIDNTTCKNNGGTVWSYNQGVILGALVELNRASPDSSLIPKAKQIADAAITNLTDANGILHDVCEPDCGADGSQFKGVFARNLQILQKASPEKRYKTFLDKNANSIWANDRNWNNELSVIWSGPFIAPANASTQSSAMDALLASLAT